MINLALKRSKIPVRVVNLRHFSLPNGPGNNDFGFESATKTFDQIKDLLYPEDQ